MPILFDPKKELHHCAHPKGVSTGTIWLCDECGQHWQYDPDIFGNWWRISERKAQKIIRRARR